MTDAGVLQCKIAQRVMLRVRHQHNVRPSLSGRRLAELSEGIIRKHVTIDEQERRIAEKRQGLNNAARSLERGLL